MKRWWCSARSLFIFDFYANAADEPLGYEGRRHLRSFEVTTDADGKAAFDRVLSAATSADERITATATGPDGTSEFSPVRDVTNRPPTAHAGGPYTIPEGGSLTLDALGSSDPDGDPLDYSWDVNGDGTFGDATGVNPSLPWAALVSLGITDGNNTSLYEVRVRIDDGHGHVATSEPTALMINNLAPQDVSAGADQTVDEGATVNLSGTFTDPGSADTHTLSWAVASSNGQVIAGGTGASFSFVPNDNGTYTVTFTVTDDDGSSASDGVVVTVLNVNPTVDLTGPAVGSVYAVGTTIAFTGTYAEPGTTDTHTATLTLSSAVLPAPLTYSVTVSGGAVSIPCTIAAAGVYRVTLTITDDDGGAGFDSTIGTEDAYVVLYDPTAGFVTGGGWITSPAGAYTADASLTGRANFGFVSRYQKGAKTPSGNTEFQFRLADLNFSSTSYEWLVVAGARAQYKGQGTINGAGGYGFLLTAVDSTLR